MVQLHALHALPFMKNPLLQELGVQVPPVHVLQVVGQPVFAAVVQVFARVCVPELEIQTPVPLVIVQLPDGVQFWLVLQVHAWQLLPFQKNPLLQLGVKPQPALEHVPKLGQLLVAPPLQVLARVWLPQLAFHVQLPLVIPLAVAQLVVGVQDWLGVHSHAGHVPVWPLPTR